MEKVSVQRGVRCEWGRTSVGRMARGLYFQGNERYGVCRHLDEWDSCLKLMTFFFFASHISKRIEWTPNRGLDIYMCVWFFFFSYCWYVVIQFSSCHTQNIRLLTRSALFFSLSHSVIKVKHSKRPELQMRHADLPPHPVICWSPSHNKDVSIHIHDRNLVISEHPIPYTYTHAWHTPQRPSWIFMSVVPQIKTVAVQGHYLLTQAVMCDGDDSSSATQDLFTGGCHSLVNTLISPFCWNNLALLWLEMTTERFKAACRSQASLEQC